MHLPVRRWKAALYPISLLAVLSLCHAQDEQRDRAERMRLWQEAREMLHARFSNDPGAKVPAADLPDFMVEALDADGDGFVTRSEVEEARRQQREQSQEAGPRDRSGFTFLHPEGFPLNVDPQIVSAGEAALGDDDIVLGVVIDGQARAYPVNYMNGPYNEVVNDTLGGQAIASTW